MIICTQLFFVYVPDSRIFGLYGSYVVTEVITHSTSFIYMEIAFYVEAGTLNFVFNPYAYDIILLTHV